MCNMLVMEVGISWIKPWHNGGVQGLNDFWSLGHVVVVVIGKGIPDPYNQRLSAVDGTDISTSLLQAMWANHVAVPLIGISICLRKANSSSQYLLYLPSYYHVAATTVIHAPGVLRSPVQESPSR